MISIAAHTDIYRGLLGGALIGASSSLFLSLSGRISGMSGILAHAIRSKDDNGDSWHSFVDKSITSFCYIAGLLLSGFVMRDKRPEVFGDGGSQDPYSLNILGLAVAATLVGLGTRLGNGCTSGHGVCGLPRRSKRSLAAVMTFMCSGMVCAYVMRVYGATTWPLNALLASSPEETEASLTALLTDSQGRPKSVLALALSAFASHLLMRYASDMSKSVAREPPKSLQEQALAKADTVGTAHLHIFANLVSAVCGSIFGIGLCLSGMTDRSRVYHFLDCLNPSTGWDLTLMGVMGGAVVVNAVTFELFRQVQLMPLLLKLKLSKRVLAANSQYTDCKRINTLMDPQGAIDAKLLVGASLFGCGWGIGGICPGPALVSTMAPHSKVVIFFCMCMFVVMGLYPMLDNAINQLGRPRVGGSRETGHKQS